MFISIAGIAVLYLLMNISVVSVIPWQHAKDSEFVVSEFIQILAGNTAAKIATCLIFGLLLHRCFPQRLATAAFLMPRRLMENSLKFSASCIQQKISLMFLCFSLEALHLFSVCFLNLRDVISAILAMRIMIQFIGQAIGLLILRSKKNEIEFPYKMPLFPVPVILAIAMWIFILFSTGSKLMSWGLFIIFLGAIVYFIKAKIRKEWPFVVK